MEGGGRLPLGFGTHSYTFFLSKELSKLPAKFRVKCFSSFPYWFNEEIECLDRNVSLCFILKFLFVVSENLLLKMCQLTRQFNGESMKLMFGQNILNYLTNFFLVIKLRKMWHRYFIYICNLLTMKFCQVLRFKCSLSFIIFQSKFHKRIANEIT